MLRSPDMADLSAADSQTGFTSSSPDIVDNDEANIITIRVLPKKINNEFVGCKFSKDEVNNFDLFDKSINGTLTVLKLPDDIETLHKCLEDMMLIHHLAPHLDLAQDAFDIAVHLFYRIVILKKRFDFYNFVICYEQYYKPWPVFSEEYYDCLKKELNSTKLEENDEPNQQVIPSTPGTNDPSEGNEGARDGKPVEESEIDDSSLCLPLSGLLSNSSKSGTSELSLPSVGMQLNTARSEKSESSEETERDLVLREGSPTEGSPPREVDELLELFPFLQFEPREVVNVPPDRSVFGSVDGWGYDPLRYVVLMPESDLQYLTPKKVDEVSDLPKFLKEHTTCEYVDIQGNMMKCCHKKLIFFELFDRGGVQIIPWQGDDIYCCCYRMKMHAIAKVHPTRGDGVYGSEYFACMIKKWAFLNCIIQEESFKMLKAANTWLEYVNGCGIMIPRSFVEVKVLSLRTAIIKASIYKYLSTYRQDEPSASGL